MFESIYCSRVSSNPPYKTILWAHNVSYKNKTTAWIIKKYFKDVELHQDKLNGVIISGNSLAIQVHHHVYQSPVTGAKLECSAFYYAGN